MGAELQATVRVGRKTAAGKALLEASEIIFRSPDLRLTIAFKDMTALEAKAGILKVSSADVVAFFSLGVQAEKWADKIRNPKGRLDKIGVKAAHRIALINVKDAAFLAELRERAASVSSGRVVKEADAIFVGATTLDALAAKLPDLVPYIKRDGAIWTVTPKGKGGIKDTDIMAAAKAAGLVAVKVVSFSDTQSANKFVIPRANR